MKKIIIILILGLFLINSCSKATDEDNQILEKTIEEKCINLCLEEINKQNLSNGPCLSNAIQTDWVCDVAHSPRQDIDNIQENQCSSYREGLTHHFVEVNPNCEFIRKV